MARYRIKTVKFIGTKETSRGIAIRGHVFDFYDTLKEAIRAKQTIIQQSKRKEK